MEFEPENQILQNVPSISVVSQEQDEVTSDSRKDYGKTPSHCSDSVSDKNAIQSNQAVTNGVTTVETKIETSQIVSELTPSIMPESILAEVNEPTTKAINLNSNLLSIDLPVTEAQRQSSPFITSKGSDERLDLITKEEMKIQDLSKVVNHSDNITQGIYMAQAESRNEERQESCRQDACKTQIPFSETKNGFDAAMPEAMTSLKDNPVQEEVLDLSLPKKKVRDNREKCKWVLDSEYEGSLLMEVDEIENETQHVEVEQDEDDEECWFSLCNDDHTNSLNLENWEQHSVPHVAIESPCTSFLSLNSKDTLLIDDQGIPYTLDPDGKKVPQIDPCEMPEVASEEISLGFEPFVDEESAGSQGADPAQDSTSDFSIETSQDTLILENKSPQDHSDEAVSAALQDISSLPSLPIQIMASNTGTNTPILLLPQSQLQTFSSSATNSNPGVMALTLPLALAQNTQSSPVFLLLSSPQVSEIPSSTLSGQLSQISSTSCIALPSLGLKTDPVSCTATTTPNTITTTDVSGQKNKPCKSSSVPTSPTASTSTSPMIPIGQTKQIKSEACSDTPTSFQEALLRLAVSAVQKAENQPKSAEALSVVTTLTDTTQSGSSSATNTQEDNGKMEEVSSPISELDQTDSPSLSTTSPVCPSSPIFPTNHPKNQDSQNQSLGPRRILYCQYCPRVFYYLSDLERHSITHSQSKPHVCQLCGKAFKRSSHLERHKHIHTGQRNFVCQLCPRRFREAAELTRHQRVHTGEKPFQCLLCHMRFAERNTLRRHTKRKHQGQQQEAMSIKVKPQTEGVSLLNIQGQQEENAEWYSSTMTEMDSDNDTGGE